MDTWSEWKIIGKCMGGKSYGKIEEENHTIHERKKWQKY